MFSERINMGCIAAAIVGTLAGTGLGILLIASKKGEKKVDQPVKAQSQRAREKSVKAEDVESNGAPHHSQAGSSSTPSVKPDVLPPPDSPPSGAKVAELEEDSPLPPAKRIAPGILVHEVSLQKGNITRQIWIYLPEQAANSSFPCVLVAPAGTPLIHGSDISLDDRAEHLPYVRAGMAVVAYSIDGSLAHGDQKNERAVIAAAKAFKEAKAGVANARQALDYALAKVPSLDRRRVYTAGHSSAATLSLLVGEHEPRIKACVAYAPVTNVVQHLPAPLVQAFSLEISGFDDFITESSPHTHIDQLRCPVFLFHAEDDSNVPIRQSAEFAADLKTTNSSVTFVRARSGNHYDSMIQEGMPRAIRWLQQLSKE